MIEVVERVELPGGSVVEYLNHGNDDDTVRDAARVSHDACSKSASPTLIKYLADNDHFTPFTHVRFETVIVARPSDMLRWSLDKLPGWVVEQIPERVSSSPEINDLCIDDDRTFRISGSLYNWLGPTEDFPPVFSLFRSIILGQIALLGCRDSVVSFCGEVNTGKFIEKAKSHDCDQVLRVSPKPWKAFRITAPLMVLNQLMRSNHEVGWNQVSRRYINSTPEFFVPTEWRRKPRKGIKQGSGEGSVRTFLSKSIQNWIDWRGCFPFAVDLATTYYDFIQTSRELYKLFDEAGVAPELSRCVLTTTTMSSVWMSASDRAIGRVTGLRSNRGQNNHAQKEIEDISRAIEGCLTWSKK